MFPRAIGVRVERGGPRGAGAWLICFLIFCALDARGQSLRYRYTKDLTKPSPRFDQGRMFAAPYGTRDIVEEPPDYATLRLGPFFSSWYFTQQAGYRYVRTKGTGVDFLTRRRRAVFKKDGSEFPLISTFDTRNYLLITRNMDLDLSVSARYAHYPLDTQEDEFYVQMAEEGVFGNISFAVDLTPYVRAIAYDALVWRTDYVDTRGMIDEYGGRKYEYFQNTVGLNLDWQFAKNKDILGMLSREDFIPRSDEFKDQERTTYRESLQYEQTIFADNLIGGARVTWSQNYYDATNRPDSSLEEYLAYLRYYLGKAGEPGARLRLTEASSIEAGLGYSGGFTYGAEEGIRRGDVEEKIHGRRHSAQGGLVGYVGLTTQIRRDLVHNLRHAKGVRAGFNSAFELYDEYSYRITWRGDVTTVSAYSIYTSVKPSWEAVNEYSTWASGLDTSYPLTRYIRLFFTTAYTEHNNKGVTKGPLVEEEWQYDYATWISRLGTAFTIRPNLDFVTYGEHMVRWSDADDLEFTRDIFEAMLIYRHQF